MGYTGFTLVLHYKSINCRLEFTITWEFVEFTAAQEDRLRLFFREGRLFLVAIISFTWWWKARSSVGIVLLGRVEIGLIAAPVLVAKIATRIVFITLRLICRWFFRTFSRSCVGAFSIIVLGVGLLFLAKTLWLPFCEDVWLSSFQDVWLSS